MSDITLRNARTTAVESNVSARSDLTEALAEEPSIRLRGRLASQPVFEERTQCRSRRRRRSRTCSSRSARSGWTARRTSCSSACAASARCTSPRRSTEYPEEEGFWSVTTAEGVHAVSRDWQTYSSELGGITALTDGDHAAGDAAGHVHRDGPAQARPAEGALPARLHPAPHRRARGRDPRDHHRRARPPRGPRDGRPRHGGRAARRRARDRVLHGHRPRGRRDLGAADEHDARRRRPGPQPRGPRDRHAARHPARSSSAARKLDRRRAARTRPTTSPPCSSTPSSTARGSRTTRSSWASSC